MLLSTSLLFLLTLWSPVTAQNTGFSPGNWAVQSWDVGTPDWLTLAPSVVPFHLQVWAPVSCQTQCGAWTINSQLKFPIMVFVTGFGATIRTSEYQDILSDIASQGIVVVAVDRSYQLTLTTDYVFLAQKFGRVVAYIQGTYANATLQGNSLAGDLALCVGGSLSCTCSVSGSGGSCTGGKAYPLQTDKFYYAAHSSGNHVTTQYIGGTAALQNPPSCNSVAGVIMLSPLDGQDPLGFGGAQVIMPGDNKLPFITNGLLIGAQFDYVASANFPGAPCCPEYLCSPHFADAWQGQLWSIMGAQMGHLDLLDENADSGYSSFCYASNASNVEGRALYRNMISGSIFSFIAGLYSGNTQYFSNIESTTLMGGPSVAYALTYTGSNPGVCKYHVWINPMPYETQLGLTLFGIFFALVFTMGVCCFFRRMDEDSVARYLPSDIVDQDDNFVPYMQAHMEPVEFKHHMMQYSARLDGPQGGYDAAYSAQYEQGYEPNYSQQMSSQMSAKIEV